MNNLDIRRSVIYHLNNLEKCNINDIYNFIENYDVSHYIYFKEVINEKNPRNLLNYLKKYYKINNYDIVNYNSILFQYIFYGELKIKTNFKKIIEKLKKKIRSKIVNYNILFRGKRKYMEDRILTYEDDKIYISLVLDGHGGKECAEYIKKKFLDIFFEKKKIYKNYEIILNITIKTLNNLIMTLPFTSGSTCNLLLIDKKEGKYHVMNIGDSRCIALMKNNSIKQISIDHRLTEQRERDFIVLKGGEIINNRVNGVLGLSRSLGDKKLKKYISSKADYYTGNIKDIYYFFQGTDGVFDFKSNEQIINFINKYIKNYKRKYIFMQTLIKYIYKKSEDNISCSLTFLS